MFSRFPERGANSLPPSYFAAGWRAVTSELARDPRILAGTIRAWAWSPIVWRDGIRKRTHFLGADWLVLDHDDGSVTLDDARTQWAEFTHVIGTTKSHQVGKGGLPPCDRFRVCILLDEPITDSRDYEALMHLAVKEFSSDKACVDGARWFYPCVEIISVHEGKAAEWRGVVEEEYERARATVIQPDPGQKQANPANYSRTLMTYLTAPHGSITEGERNKRSFSAALALFFSGWNRGEIINVVSLKTTLGLDEITRLVDSAETYFRQRM